MEFRDIVSEFYLEGNNVHVICINRNVQPFDGNTFWVGPMNMPVGNGDVGVLEFTALRSLVGLYTCGVNSSNQPIMISAPTRSFTLVVHCKF